MADKHAVVRTDGLHGTTNRENLRSVRYMLGGEYTAIDNGNVVEIKALLDGERDVYEASDMTTTTPFGKLALIASVEMMYDERLKDLSDFYNDEESIQRAYLLQTGDRFSVTEEALSGVPDLGNFIDKASGTKLAVSVSAGADTIGDVIAIEIVGTRVFYVIEIR